MTSQEKLNVRTSEGLHICVGLDTDINKIPEHLKKYDNPVFEFNKIIIESTQQTAAAFKINFAFYERDGIEGLRNLEKTIKLIPDNVLIIGDSKRGDIGNTSQMYAESMFKHFNLDASTLNPYMGIDSISPFLEYENKINFILALTSNKSSFDFEKQKLEDGSFLYQKVIKKVNEWNSKNNCGIVFGATNSQELNENMNLINKLFVLLPGVGAQGGSLEDVVKAFKSIDSKNYIINVSRALLYADASINFGEIANSVLNDYNKKVAALTL
ncbi:MAG: orotidine-5'-phosphate decarboxylase [Bacteroidetes bacterium]|nr:orotidine-5'-phosphate decarboxylase [Bacteroidota bacterium]